MSNEEEEEVERAASVFLISLFLFLFFLFFSYLKPGPLADRAGRMSAIRPWSLRGDDFGFECVWRRREKVREERATMENRGEREAIIFALVLLLSLAASASAVRFSSSLKRD